MNISVVIQIVNDKEIAFFVRLYEIHYRKRPSERTENPITWKCARLTD